MRRRMALVISHVRRALLIGKTIHHRDAEATCFTDILDGLSAGLILVDATGLIVHADAAGNTMLAAADFLRKTTCCGPIAGERRSTWPCARSSSRQASATQPLASRASPCRSPPADGERYVAHVLPLTSGARRHAGLAYEAVAALFVRKAALQAFSPPGIIGEMYHLTPTELRVLLAIVDVGGVPEVQRRSASPPPLSRPISAACLKRPALAVRPIWSSWLPDSPRRWRADTASFWRPPMPSAG